MKNKVKWDVFVEWFRLYRGSNTVTLGEAFQKKFSKIKVREGIINNTDEKSAYMQICSEYIE